jgi:hypothetical protein
MQILASDSSTMEIMGCTCLRNLCITSRCLQLHHSVRDFEPLRRLQTNLWYRALKGPKVFTVSKPTDGVAATAFFSSP